MLLCDQKTFYIGICNNVKRRLEEHKENKSFFTKKFSDLKVVYCEKYDTRHKAAVREKQLKGWSHTKKQKLTEGELGINCIEFDEVLDWNWTRSLP